MTMKIEEWTVENSPEEVENPWIMIWMSSCFCETPKPCMKSEKQLPT